MARCGEGCECRRRIDDECVMEVRVLQMDVDWRSAPKSGWVDRNGLGVRPCRLARGRFPVAGAARCWRCQRVIVIGVQKAGTGERLGRGDGGEGRTSARSKPRSYLPAAGARTSLK